jgi:hypothetical protein
VKFPYSERLWYWWWRHLSQCVISLFLFLTYSSQVKQCSNKFSFKAGNRWKLLGAIPRLHKAWANAPQRNFVACFKSAVPCVVGYHHTIANKTGTVSPDDLLQDCSMAQYMSVWTLHLCSQVQQQHTWRVPEDSGQQSANRWCHTLQSYTSLCLNEFLDTCNSDFYHRPLYCQSHCPCHMQTLGTIW